MVFFSMPPSGTGMASNHHRSASPSPPTASAATTRPVESHSNIETPTKPHQQCAPSHGCCALGDASTCNLCNVTASACNRAIADQNLWDLFLKEYEENCCFPIEAENKCMKAKKNRLAYLEAERRLFGKFDAQKKRSEFEAEKKHLETEAEKKRLEAEAEEKCLKAEARKK